ncbi:MAG: phosphate ABC transporter permease subunit PstC [Proteobacteria bacterium]|nr:phosphate ABC transporter permease subunit PstC [Pseudomonadota bacterium]
MNSLILTAVLLLLLTGAYQFGRKWALSSAGGDSRNLHSLPGYHGAYVGLWCAVPALVIGVLWFALEGQVLNGMLIAQMTAEQQQLAPSSLELLLNDIRNIALGGFQGNNPDPQKLALAERFNELQRLSTLGLAALAAVMGIGGILYSTRRISPRMRARQTVEKVVRIIFIICSVIAVLTTIGIVLSLVFEALRFFAKVSFIEFLFGLKWSPQTALRADQVGALGTFGAIPVFAGTLLITAISMVVAVPIGLLSAIYMAEYASPRVRNWVKPLLEILAGVPTVVYGFFAALTVGPYLRGFGESIGLDVASESALAAGLVMGIMIIPFVSSLSDDVINAVPQALRDGSYAMGATKSETVKQVVIPAALPGIVGSVLLAVSRAIGETMIVVMAAGLSANLTANPFEAVTTVTVQIVTLLVGDQEFDSAKTLAAFALGLVLFLVTLVLNIIALTVVRKYRNKYD